MGTNVEVVNDISDELKDFFPVVIASICRVLVADGSGAIDDEHNIGYLRAAYGGNAFT